VTSAKALVVCGERSGNIVQHADISKLRKRALALGSFCGQQKYPVCGIGMQH
jgi:hypothetical protein